MSKTAIPRPEHPRPQMVRDTWLNLNGPWSFAIDPGVSGEAQGWSDGRAFKQRIMVPFCPESKLSGIGHTDFMASVWYQRKFTVPAAWQDLRLLLHFDAVDYESTVWVNGRPAGTHTGGSTPFTCEITALVKKGENTITLCAKDDTRSELQPTGKQSVWFDSRGCHYTRVTGIWQTVWLEAVPQTYIKSYRVYPNLSGGTISLLVIIDGNVDGVTLVSEARARGTRAGRMRVGAENVMHCVLPLSRIEAWSPEHPFLYDLTLTLDRGGKTIDVVTGYCGLRTITIAGKQVLLNGKPVFQRLVLDQGYYPDGIYTAPAAAALKRDIELSLAAGFNGARLHQKVFEPLFLYWADRLGYLVWGEYPSWGLDLNEQAVLARVSTEWAEVVERDFSHPSIVGWCPFNETEHQHNPSAVAALYRLTKALDPTRPCIDTSGYIHTGATDIYDCHNYQQDPATFAELFEKFKTDDAAAWRNFPRQDGPYCGQPYFVSEYGGIWWNPKQKDTKSWGYGQRPKTEHEFLLRYRGLTEALLQHPKMFGFCYTQLYDVEQEVNGLYTYDRKPKFNMDIIKKITAQKAAIE
jgi:beta-galactosidase/beta-glucuronidase